MNIALIGYGKMGHAIEKIAQQRGHCIVARIDLASADTFASPEFMSADIAIEFTQPQCAIDNYRKAWDAGLPVVSGTTGWGSKLEEIQSEVQAKGYTLFWASNFSVGVNIFFELNKHLARIMNTLTQYDVSMKEIHHKHKKDAPSGTAITLAEGVLENIDRKEGWALVQDATLQQLPIEAIREGEVNGFHSVTYTSDMDAITIQHNATSREGFALGAVLAAEFVASKKGYYSMSDLLEILLDTSKHS